MGLLGVLVAGLLYRTCVTAQQGDQACYAEVSEPYTHFATKTPYSVVFNQDDSEVRFPGQWRLTRDMFSLKGILLSDNYAPSFSYSGFPQNSVFSWIFWMNQKVRIILSFCYALICLIGIHISETI